MIFGLRVRMRLERKRTNDRSRNWDAITKDKSEITYKMDFDDLNDERLVLKLRDEANALLLEKGLCKCLGVGFT